VRSLLSRAEDLPLSQGPQHCRISQHSRTYPHRSLLAQLLRYPSVQQGMQLPLTFPQSMLGPRIAHQLLGLIGPLVNLSGTARGEAGVREAVDEQQGPRRDRDGALGPVGLGGERDYGDDLVGEGACGDDHRAAEGVAHEDDARAAAALQELEPGPHVQHGLDVHAWVAVVEAQRGETLSRERLGHMRKDALGGPGVATASAPDPEHRPHSTLGALVQNRLDRAQGGMEQHPLAGVALVGGPVSTPKRDGAGVWQR